MNALQIAVQEMGLEQEHPGALKTITDVHRIRNEKIYRQPIPPVSGAIAKATIKLLTSALPKARQLVALSSKPDDDETESPGPGRR